MDISPRHQVEMRLTLGALFLELGGAFGPKIVRCPDQQGSSMCGRFTLKTPVDDLAKFLRLAVTSNLVDDGPRQQNNMAGW